MFEGKRLQFFWRGRVALYAILKALGIGRGDRVLVPGFTCVAVPNAVLYAGATPAYVDIDPDTYNVSRGTIEPHVDASVRAIIVQSSFGLSADLDPILELAGRHGIPVVEDCAHGLGGNYKGRANGTVADAAFFSTQWSKPISTGLGGVALANDADLADRLDRLASAMPAPPLSARLMLRAQFVVRPLANRPALHYPLVETYRWLTQRVGLSVGSSSAEELSGAEMPPRFELGMAPAQRRLWQQGLGSLADAVERRRRQAERFDAFFRTTSIGPPARPVYARHAMLRYTIRVADSSATLARARELRVPLGDWFTSPLYPVEGDLRPWGYEAGSCPEAERACREVVNLLPDQPPSDRQLGRLFGRGAD